MGTLFRFQQKLDALSCVTKIFVSSQARLDSVSTQPEVRKAGGAACCARTWPLSSCQRRSGPQRVRVGHDGSCVASSQQADFWNLQLKFCKSVMWTTNSSKGCQRNKQLRKLPFSERCSDAFKQSLLTSEAQLVSACNLSFPISFSLHLSLSLFSRQIS